jgi:crotonobetainyl-CoA:carnitine CoA-transferase CaiB-like acyl-CoA transferase
MKLIEGVRVLSFNHFLMGPMGVQHLADLGADVIAVEPPAGAFQRHWSGGNVWVGTESMLQWCANRNKRSLAVDLKRHEGREIVQKLVKSCDAVTENFRPGVMERLGLGFEQLKKIKPDLIYASGSGFGHDGPYAERPGQDLVLQAFSGLAAVNGQAPDGASPVGVSAVDHHGAALFAMGILAALLHRQQTGQGMRVDVSLLGSAIDLQAESYTCYLNEKSPGSLRRQGDSGSWYQPGPYGIYKCKDGAIAISNCSVSELGGALQCPALASIPDSQGFQRQEEICSIVAKQVASWPLATLLKAMEERQIWHAPVCSYDEVVEDPQVKHNGHFVRVLNEKGTPFKVVTHPVRYNGAAPEVRLIPQQLGAQTAAILHEIGYSMDEIKDLESRAIVKCKQGGE